LPPPTELVVENCRKIIVKNAKFRLKTSISGKLLKGKIVGKLQLSTCPTYFFYPTTSLVRTKRKKNVKNRKCVFVKSTDTNYGRFALLTFRLGTFPPQNVSPLDCPSVCHSVCPSLPCGFLIRKRNGRKKKQNVTCVDIPQRQD